MKAKKLVVEQVGAPPDVKDLFPIPFVKAMLLTPEFVDKYGVHPEYNELVENGGAIKHAFLVWTHYAGDIELINTPAVNVEQTPQVNPPLF